MIGVDVSVKVEDGGLKEYVSAALLQKLQGRVNSFLQTPQNKRDDKMAQYIEFVVLETVTEHVRTSALANISKMSVRVEFLDGNIFLHANNLYTFLIVSGILPFGDIKDEDKYVFHGGTVMTVRDVYNNVINFNVVPHTKRMEPDLH